MERLVIDTNLYVDWINAGRHESLLFHRDAVKYLSAVVLMELRAGAATVRDRRLLDDLARAFARIGRILAPSSTVFGEAGDVLRALAGPWRIVPGRASRLANDVLIALSARSIGATVITRNGRDFEAIRSVRPFGLRVID